MAVFTKVQKIGIQAAQPRMDGCDEAFPAMDVQEAFLSCDRNEYVMFPGFCDVHVHFREPGFSYKETILSGSRAAASSGYTAVCTMPNLNPVPDSPEHLKPQQELIKGAPVSVLPYGAITVGEKGRELSDLEGLAPHVIAFSDDGVGVRDSGLMREAMQRCKALGRLIAGHCEDMRYEDPREREWRELERNLRLADETGCPFHACHISTKESVSLIREAKRSGVDVSCETAPHYLLLNKTLLEDDGRFKMNPPIHEIDDQAALLEALADGTMTAAGVNGGNVAAWYMTGSDGSRLLVVHHTGNASKTLRLSDDLSHPVAVLGSASLSGKDLKLGASSSVVFKL